MYKPASCIWICPRGKGVATKRLYRIFPAAETYVSSRPAPIGKEVRGKRPWRSRSKGRCSNISGIGALATLPTLPISRSWKRKWLIRIMQQSKTDSIGIGQHARNTIPYAEWSRLDWSEAFTKADIRVQVDVHSKIKANDSRAGWKYPGRLVLLFPR
ncbi:hypothetical protein FE784_16995 [Paenibacillus hemerocallicola]|uniref:Spore germination GerAC-like C-terminal domain-containing protein n=1 Tax=Paenibacillus hemerocallicola TaxID=1172614 RepID=A0A5C4T7L0_9BACL|nr:hypothetical protein FE784_16995 [Paenibacillus hemerocallicola]